MIAAFVRVSGCKPCDGHNLSSRWLPPLHSASTIRSLANSRGSTFLSDPRSCANHACSFSTIRWRRSWASTSTVARCHGEGSDIRRKHTARRRRTAGSGLRWPPVRRILTSTRRRPRASSRRGDRPARTPSRHRLQGLGPHAVRPRRRRQGRRRSHASRGAGRRGHARARHSHHPRASRS